jgi:hypothetical protein
VIDSQAARVHDFLQAVALSTTSSDLAMLGRVDATASGPQLARPRMACGRPHLVCGDVIEARDALSEVAPTALRAGSVQTAVWSISLVAIAELTAGSWGEASSHANRAVSLLDEDGMEWLRPLARYAALLVPAARGDGEAAEAQLCGATVGCSGPHTRDQNASITELSRQSVRSGT